MSDPEEHTNPADESEARIDRLVRLLGDSAELDAPRLSDEAIVAFLSGRASADQEVEILRRLETSRILRHELAEVAADLDLLRDIKPGSIESESEKELSLSVLRQIEKLPTGKLFRVRGVATFLAVAALVLITVLVSTPSGPEFTLVAEAIERSELISFKTRGSQPAGCRMFESDSEAALFGIKNALEYQNARFVPSKQESTIVPLAESIPWNLKISYPYTNTTYLFSARILERTYEDRTESYFVLTLPARNLYRLPAKSTDMAVDWSLGPTELICVVLVHLTNEGYCAAQTEVFTTK